MSDPVAPGWPPLLFWAGAAALLLVDFGLSLALASAATLSRVTLQRISGEADGRLVFLAEWEEAASGHRLAATLARQLSLLGAALLAVLGAQSAGWSYAAVLAVALTCVVGVLLLEGTLALLLGAWQPRLALHSTSWLVRAVRLLLYPLMLPLQWVLVRVDSGGPTSDEEDQEEQVDALIQVGEREGLLQAAEGEMMRGIADLDATRVREIMTPRIDIIALPEEITVAEARRRLLEAGHSRLPVYRGGIDNVVGVLHARDLFRAWEEQKDSAVVSDYLRPVIHVPEGLSAAQLLAEMRMRTKIALVVDEFGGVSGLVTLEDVLEEIVGEIRDEHDQDEDDNIQQQPDGSWVVKALAHVEELEDLLGVDFGERDFDTVGGLVVSRFGRVPQVGEAMEVQGLRIRVLQAGRRRIVSVRVEPRPADGAGS